VRISSKTSITNEVFTGRIRSESSKEHRPWEYL